MSSTAPAAASSAAPASHGSPSSSLRKYYQTEYPKQTWFLFGAVLALLLAFRLLALALALLRRVRFRSYSRSADAETGSDGKTPGPLPAWLRVLVALAEAWKIVWFRSTVHFGFGYSLNVAECFLTAAYIVALFTWSFVNTQNLTLNWWANRTGTLAAAQFPLVTALGTKNNVISWVTGIGHEKLNYLHRMTARVSLILLWVHGGARFALMRNNPHNQEDWHEAWFRLGLAATIGLSALVLCSLRPVRERRYEFFVWFHFAIVLLFLIGGYYHTKRFRFDAYLWPCFLIWALDRALRTAGLAYFYLFTPSAPSLSSPPARDEKDASAGKNAKAQPKRGKARASAALLSPHLVQLRVPRPAGFHWRAGQTAYLVLPGVSTLPVEAHPFTIASVDDSLYPASPSPPPTTSAPPSSSKSSSTTDLDAAPAPAPAPRGELRFLIGVHAGATARLAAHNAPVTALVDGPYGAGVDVARAGKYDSALLVAGGTGVAWAAPVLLDAVRRAAAAGGGGLRRVVFVWAVRERAHVAWVAPMLRETLARARGVRGLSVCVRVHVTSARETWDDDSVHSSDGNANEKKVGDEDEDGEVEGVEVLAGRPDLRALVRAEMEQGGRGMFVGVCGSASLAEAVRAAVRVNPFWGPGSVLRGGPSVDLVVESFGYA